MAVLVICAVCGEQKPHMAKGLCGRCYQRQYMRQRRTDPAVVERGRLQSREYQRKLQAQSPASIRERSRLYRQQHPEKVRAAWYTWEQANPEKVRASARTSARRQRERYPEKVRRLRVNGKNRWRARLIAAFVEAVDVDVVYERDAGVCGICGVPTLKSEASLDHIVPLSKGGEHSYANIRLAHTICNVRRGGTARATTVESTNTLERAIGFVSTTIPERASPPERTIP